MPGNFLKNGSAWLTNQLREHCSDPVEYHRSGESPLSLVATIGSSEFDQVDDSGVVFQTRGKDFLIRTADLDFGDGAVEPVPGDLLKWADGAGSIHSYEVVPSGAGGAFRYADQHRHMLRIHTTYIGSETE
jgi:hypothetical protein